MTSVNTSKDSLQPKVIADKESELPPVSAIMDTRLPYNMEYVMCSLLQIMVARGMLSINDAKIIMASGDSYLH